jgi:nucleoside-diphosphate-sugar epimerase
MAGNRKKILITGASGLIGRELCEQISPHNDVTAVDNNQRFRDYVPKNCTYVRSNLIEYLDQTSNKFDIIYHMAATNGTKYFYSQPNDVLRNNVTLDLSMFKFAESNPECKLVYASSSEVMSGATVFPTPELTDIAISNIHNARWSYMLPKILAENYLFNSNIDFLVIRFFNVYSEHSGSGHFVKDIVEKIRNKNFELVGADETRSFCYVSDAVDAVIKISNASRCVVNVGSDEELTILDAANIIARVLGEHNVTWVTKPGLPGSAKNRRPDITELKRLLPTFSPKPFNEVLNKLYRILYQAVPLER